MVELSNRLFDKYNWHTELYVDSVQLKDLKAILSQIPQCSIDHLGLSKDGLSDLYYWAEREVKIKVIGFGRIDFDPIPVMRKIFNINPNGLLFGTDLPSTRASRPFSAMDIDLIRDNFTLTEQENIFYKNAKAWYFKR